MHIVNIWNPDRLILQPDFLDIFVLVRGETAALIVVVVLYPALAAFVVIEMLQSFCPPGIHVMDHEGNLFCKLFIGSARR